MSTAGSRELLQAVARVSDAGDALDAALRALARAPGGENHRAIIDRAAVAVREAGDELLALAVRRAEVESPGPYERRWDDVGREAEE